MNNTGIKDVLIPLPESAVFPTSVLRAADRYAELAKAIERAHGNG